MRDAPPGTGIVEDLIRGGQIEVTWSRGASKWVRLRDPLTGLEAQARSAKSWREALTLAETRLIRLLRDHPR